MPTVIEILKKARETMADPARWTQGVLARDANGFAVSWTSSRAVCFCAGGHINLAAGFEVSPKGHVGSILRRMSGQQLVVFNDSHTHDEVLNLFDSAIEALQEKPVAVFEVEE